MYLKRMTPKLPTNCVYPQCIIQSENQMLNDWPILHNGALCLGLWSSLWEVVMKMKLKDMAQEQRDGLQKRFDRGNP